MSYLNVDEVDSALKALAAAYPDYAELITLPNKTFEGRTSYALRIGADPDSDAVLFTACQHGREWGGADACVYFAADLLEANATNTGLSYGGKSFNALTIQHVMSRTNIVVFPCVNPDGRKHDQEKDDLWRKNRNPEDSGGLPYRIGVDINRNHDFLWDFDTAFAPEAQTLFSSLSSDDPSNELYHGSGPDSEPETKNIHWLLDAYRFTKWHLDIHSYAGDVLFSWSNDTDQSTNPAMNFMNPAYNFKRGVDGGYGEYITSEDKTLITGVAQRVTEAVNLVRGGHYNSKQSVYLNGGSTEFNYPVSGSVDDYAFSRHLIDSTKSKVYAFTMEFGYWAGDNRTSFHPAWSEMEQLVAEVDAGMLEFCVVATPAWKPPWKNLYRKLWPWEIWDPMVRFYDRFVRPIVRQVFGWQAFGR